jgi:hypothetical protein
MYRARIFFKLLRSPGINSASLCSLAGQYDNPIPTRFLAPLDCLKIPAQDSFFHNSCSSGKLTNDDEMTQTESSAGFLGFWSPTGGLVGGAQSKTWKSFKLYVWEYGGGWVGRNGDQKVPNWAGGNPKIMQGEEWQYVCRRFSIYYDLHSCIEARQDTILTHWDKNSPLFHGRNKL